MGDFFQGRRRKVGLGLLAMALAFLGGWVRSHSLVDLVMFPGKIFPKGNSIFSCASSDGGVECQRLWSDFDASNFHGYWKSFPNDAQHRAQITRFTDRNYEFS